MDDHKLYYDPRDLWPLLVRAGFKPPAIRCFRHKFGLNTFAVCQPTTGTDVAMTFSREFLTRSVAVTEALDDEQIERIALGLAAVREREGRLFILGVGGSAGHASHAVNDFRKICGIEAYAPTDNVSELTARTNDEGWETTFVGWLRCPSSARATRCWSSPSAAATPSENVSINIVARSGSAGAGRHHLRRRRSRRRRPQPGWPRPAS